MIKVKKCRECKGKFTPRNSLQVACSLDCAKLIGHKKSVKDAKVAQTAQKRELIRQKERIKSRSDWIKEAQQSFNALRRTEDGIARNGTCISCGTKNGKQNCGHYRSVGSCPELRFEPLNTFLQCEKCNSYLSGNLINYRINLVKLIGTEKVEWLEGKHEPAKWTIDDLKAIKAEYKAKLKELKN